jgi:hypothetical protein
VEGEVQITDRVAPGQTVDGPFLRPVRFWSVGVLDYKTNGPAVVFTLVPAAGDPDFKEPVTVMIAEHDIDLVVKALRTAQGLMPPAVRDGSGKA